MVEILEQKPDELGRMDRKEANKGMDSTGLEWLRAADGVERG